MATKKQIRPNKAQIRMLIQYMKERPEFGAGKFSSVQGQAQLQREWESLKDLLNEDGPARTVEQWKVTWRDQKAKARKEGGAHNRALNETGNGPVPELSENSVLVLDTIGIEMAVGLGRAESTIGFPSPPPSSPPASAAAPEHDYVQKAGSSSGSQALSSPVQASAVAPKRNYVQKAGSSSRSQTVPKRKKALLPPDSFLSAQLAQNEISQNQLQAFQALNDTLASINSTLQQIQRELIESNGLRRTLQGHGIDQRIIFEVPATQEEVEYEEV